MIRYELPEDAYEQSLDAQNQVDLRYMQVYKNTEGLAHIKNHFQRLAILYLENSGFISQLITGDKLQCRILDVTHLFTDDEFQTCMHANPKKLWEQLRRHVTLCKYLPDQQYAGFGNFTFQVLNSLTKGGCRSAHNALNAVLNAQNQPIKDAVLRWLAAINLYPSPRGPPQPKKKDKDKGFKFVAPKKRAADLTPAEVHKELQRNYGADCGFSIFSPVCTDVQAVLSDMNRQITLTVSGEIRFKCTIDKLHDLSGTDLLQSLGAAASLYFQERVVQDVAANYQLSFSFRADNFVTIGDPVARVQIVGRQVPLIPVVNAENPVLNENYQVLIRRMNADDPAAQDAQIQQLGMQNQVNDAELRRLRQQNREMDAQILEMRNQQDPSIDALLGLIERKISLEADLQGNGMIDAFLQLRNARHGQVVQQQNQAEEEKLNNARQRAERNEEMVLEELEAQYFRNQANFDASQDQFVGLHQQRADQPVLDFLQPANNVGMMSSEAPQPRPKRTNKAGTDRKH